jgi:glutaminyl-peptide cyclotransferase
MRRSTRWCFKLGTFYSSASRSFHSTSGLCLKGASVRYAPGTVLIILLALLTSCTKVPPPTKPPRFDQTRAFQRLEQLCSFGPRNHNSEGKKQAEEWIANTLREAGAEVSVHEFQHTQKNATQSETFRNIVGRIRPDLTTRVLIGTHYDTRSTADKDPDPAKRQLPIIGANDGGSGVAVLLEMAALWKDQPPPVGVDLFFFDGEDFGRENELEDYFLGSTAYIRDFPDYRPAWGVVIDMVGDSSFAIRKERDSLARGPATVDRLWNAAARVSSHDILNERGGRVIDDHTPFLDKGIPVILMIDFSYTSFHTTGDTLDKCSPDSLGQVGRALMEAVETP